MKLLIAGGRDYRTTLDDWQRLGKLHESLGVTEVVSGGARGADSEGEDWARDNGLRVKRFSADWKKFGSRAGPLRNAQMAAYADAVVLFPGGKGTQSMHDEAVRAGIQIFDWRLTERAG